jgi:hypothetical protein
MKSEDITTHTTEPLEDRGLYLTIVVYSNLFTFGFKITTAVRCKDCVNSIPKPNNEYEKT